MEQRLNTLLSDFVVSYHKVQNFHWYAKGANFYLIHEKLDELYSALLESVDEIAETMLMLEMRPVASMKEFLELTTLEETHDGGRTVEDIMKHVLADFESLKLSVIDIKTMADSDMIYLVSALMDNYIAQFCKSIWMIRQTLK